jgi:hypothetical protein
MPRWLKFGLLIMLFLLLASIPLARQFDTGSIEGFITNDRGPVANASVEARNVMSGAIFRVESDMDGHYSLGNLRPGRYTLLVKASEYDSLWIPEIAVEPGQLVRKDMLLAARITHRLDLTRSTPTV